MHDDTNFSLNTAIWCVWVFEVIQQTQFDSVRSCCFLWTWHGLWGYKM